MSHKNINDIFPNLNLDVPDNEELKIVNEFVVNEISFDLGRVQFHDGMDGEMQLGIWYTSNKYPLIAEFDIDVKAKDLHDTGNFESEFPPSKISKINNFSRALQTEENIMDLATSKTKTGYVYENID